MKRLFSVFLVLLAATTAVYSQGATGANNRPQPIVRSPQISPKSAPKKPSKTPAKAQGSSRSNTTKNSKPPKIVTAALDVTIDQSEASIFVSQIQNGSEISISSWTDNESGKPVSFEPLEPGDYLIKVQKNGFFDEQRTVTVKAGKPNILNVALRPSTGTLSIVSDVDDAEIEIKTIGSFSGQFRGSVQAPQTYEIAVSADGYEPYVQQIKVELGQTAFVNANLKLISSEKLLQKAQINYQSANYKETLADCRLILARNPDDAQANLLMAYTYFYSQHPRESRFYLVRAVGLQAEAEIPVRLYQKEKNSETLTDGVLKINQNALTFYSASRAALNFTVSPSAVSKMEINQEKSIPSLPKPDSIEIKATVSSGKKSEKKTIRLFPRQALTKAATAGKTEISACTSCNGGDCLCQNEIRAVYEVLLNWKSGTYSRRTENSLTIPPANISFTSFAGRGFSLNLPGNWETLSSTENNIWLAPSGGVYRRQNQVRYICGLNVGVIPINMNNLQSESERFYQTLLASNSYLEKQSQSKEIFIGGRKGIMTSFAGFDVETGEEDFVEIYTAFTREGNLFYVTTVTPFNQRKTYKRTFNAVLNSVRF